MPRAACSRGYSLICLPDALRILIYEERACWSPGRGCGCGGFDDVRVRWRNLGVDVRRHDGRAALAPADRGVQHAALAQHARGHVIRPQGKPEARKKPPRSSWRLLRI